jgi:hypothetical protein
MPTREQIIDGYRVQILGLHIKLTYMLDDKSWRRSRETGAWINNYSDCIEWSKMTMRFLQSVVDRHDATQQAQPSSSSRTANKAGGGRFLL